MYKNLHKRDRKPSRNSKTSQNDDKAFSEDALTNDSVLVKELEKNISDFNKFIGNNYYVYTRYLKLDVKSSRDAAIMFIDGLVDKAAINNAVINPLLTCLHDDDSSSNLLGFISESILVEVFVMELILEIIREAGVRLPRNVGQAISIVGALVLGQAAIQAKLASPATVAIVAIAAISNFTIPSFSGALSIRTLRFAFLIVSGVLGIFGFIVLLFVLLAHLCSLRSFGVPFLAPFSPLIPGDLKDTQIRMPVWAMSRRPKIFGARDSVRQKSKLKPDIRQPGKTPARGDENDK